MTHALLIPKRFRACVRYALTFCALAFCHAALSVGASYAQQDGSLANDGRVVIKQVLTNGVALEVVKEGHEPAYAHITLGDSDVEYQIDAYESLNVIPEQARDAVRAIWQRLGEIPEKTVNIEIDTTEAPEAQEWAERVQSRVQYWYPKVVAMLDGPEAVATIPDDFKIRLVFKPFDGVAYASGREITVSSSYIKRNPKDFGLVIHETTHVAQAYPRVREVWAMEGMTDYIRYFITEPRSKNTWRIDPERSKYTDSYGVTATFYDWIVRNKDPQFIQKIHRVFRSRQSVERFCVEEYDTTMAAMWNEFISSLNSKRDNK